MVVSYKCNGVIDFQRQFAVHQAKRQEAIVGAIRKTAKSGGRIVRDRIPVAFAELQKSVDTFDTAKGATIRVDAPYAAAVEIGSRPHWMPLSRLIEWVKLRGAQGIGNIAVSGPTSAFHAASVASGLKNLERGGQLGVDAPEKVARMIQRAIAANGTLPHWYAQSSLPDIRKELDLFIRQSLTV